MKSWLVASWFLLLNLGLDSWCLILKSWINHLGFWHHKNCLVHHHKACFYISISSWHRNGRIVPAFVSYHFMHCILHKSFIHRASASNMFFVHLLFSCSLMHDPCIFVCKTKKVTIKLKQCIIRIHPCFSLVALLIAFFPRKPNFNHCYHKGRTHFMIPLLNAC